MIDCVFQIFTTAEICWILLDKRSEIETASLDILPYLIKKHLFDVTMLVFTNYKSFSLDKYLSSG